MFASLGSFLKKFGVCEGLIFSLMLFTHRAAVVEELTECCRP